MALARQIVDVAALPGGLLPGARVFTNNPNPTFGFQYESVFTGWGFPIGSDHGKFNRVALKLRLVAAATAVTSCRVRVKAGGKDGPILGQVVQSVSPAAAGTTDPTPIYFTLDKTVDSDCELYVEYVTNGKVGVLSTDVTFSSDAAKSRYTTGESTSDTPTSIITNQVSVWCELSYTSAGSTATTVKRALRGTALPPLPRIRCADFLYAANGRKTQFFRKGLIDATDPYRWDWAWHGNIAGKTYRRYYEVTSPSDGMTSGVITLADDAGRIVAAREVNVFGDTPVEPGANVNILCVGDSLTDDGTYVTELSRMFRGSGGTPAGLGYSNVTFVGSQDSDPNKNEGRSGQSWEWFATNASSPFRNAGALDIANYATANSISSIDVVVFLLSWNAFPSVASPEAADWAAYKTHVDNLIAAFVAYNASVKIILLGLQPPAVDGLGDDYGDAGAYSAYGSYNVLRRSMQGHNAMLRQVADAHRAGGDGSKVQQPHTATVVYGEVAGRYDVENNLVTTSTAVNTRNTATELLGTNGVHPGTDGYEQIADAAFAAIVAAKVH